jgi:hypothetical protein
MPRLDGVAELVHRHYRLAGTGVGLFAGQLRDNLYKLWNRMSSGSYFPGPVRGVEIPKDHGEGVRLLGVPATGDRVAQTAAAMLLEQVLEPVFHRDSYGYRPGRSINEHLARWAMHKFKRFRGKYARAMDWLQKVYQYKPDLFAHWQLVAFT